MAGFKGGEPNYQIPNPIYIYIYIHTHTHIYIYIYIHAHTHTQVAASYVSRDDRHGQGILKGPPGIRAAEEAKGMFMRVWGFGFRI